MLTLPALLSVTTLSTASTLRRMPASSSWTAADLPDLTGRTFVVTGASSGIGPVTARELARAGAHVVLAVRDTAKGERVAAAMSGDAEVRALDLADLASVRAFADGWTGDLDVLINNAGVMAVPRGSDRRRLRAADRHQPPRALRAHQPAARAHVDRPGRDRLVAARTASARSARRPQLGAPPLRPLGRLRAVQARQPAVHPRAAPTARRSRVAGARDRRAPRLRRDQPAEPPRQPRQPLADHDERQPSARAERRDGRAADAVRRDARTSRASFVGPDGCWSSAATRGSSAAPRRRATPTTRAAVGGLSEELTGVGSARRRAAA